ncbi:Uncharacterised protein [Raoultella terrigena]|nr:Uncharacterised protein [Raoultella terrigena]
MLSAPGMMTENAGARSTAESAVVAINKQMQYQCVNTFIFKELESTSDNTARQCRYFLWGLSQKRQG